MAKLQNNAICRIINKLELANKYQFIYPIIFFRFKRHGIISQRLEGKICMSQVRVSRAQVRVRPSIDGPGDLWPIQILYKMMKEWLYSNEFKNGDSVSIKLTIHDWKPTALRRVESKFGANSDDTHFHLWKQQQNTHRNSERFTHFRR